MDYSKSDALVSVTEELAFQNEEREKCAEELIIASKELVFQHTEKENGAVELISANKELAFQNEEKEKRAAELIIANKELVFQNTEKEKRAAELIIANKELAFQNEEKEKRAAELIIANKELAFQNEEKEKRAAELIAVNKELLFQNGEKEKRAAELIIANKELAFQNEEKEKRAVELKESEKRYSDLFRLSPDPRWVYDPQTAGCLQVNNAATACYGYSEHEFLTMNIHDLETENKETKKKEYPQDLYKNKESFAGRQGHYKKTGERIYMDIYSNPILINDKLYRSVVAIDVTEKILHGYKITRAIIKTQEDERYEIGAELHDNVCQILASSLMSFRLLKDSLDSGNIELFNKSQEYILLATEEIRNLSHRLAPAFFDDSTLEEAFQRLMRDFNPENKFEITLYFDKTVIKAKISMDLQLNLYRILQEQLSNILKHAEATRINVDVIIHKQKLKMQVTDNGKGFNVNTVKNGIGISNMKRRAELFFGRMEVNSSEGKGCEMTVEIPLNENAVAG